MTSESIVPAARCTTMEEVRAGIDQVDAEIVTLFARRMRYIEAAARIKPDRDAVRDEPRKAEVIDHACAVAREQDFPEALARQIYETLVEESIAYEFDRFDRR
jgi:isochorismate pyruvate lyase